MKASCTICKYREFDKISSRVRDSTNHKIIKCRKCKHVQIYPIPSIDEDKEFYDKDMQNKNINFYGSIEDHRRISVVDTTRRSIFVNKLTPKNGRILEIGSGHGFFVGAMHKKKYNITGIEISIEKRTMAKKVTKAKILDIDLNHDVLDIGKFDTIVMFHVLEHIADPISFLKKIRSLLKPGGKIIIEVPNCDDFQLELNRSYRDFYWQRAHLQYFSPKTLKKILSLSGLSSKIIGIQRYSVENMFSWKLTNKPSLISPAFDLPKPYEWIEKPYKNKLEKELKCDTIMAIGKLDKSID